MGQLWGETWWQWLELIMISLMAIALPAWIFNRMVIWLYHPLRWRGLIHLSRFLLAGLGSGLVAGVIGLSWV